MDPIDDFIQRYSKEYDFYDQAGRLAAQKLEAELRSAGVRCMVTHRAKNISRLEEKCRQRHRRQAYGSTESIYADIVDLSGVRVALYFPAERHEVDKVISRLFSSIRKKEFPEPGKERPGKRFSGYSAVHYRAQISSASLGDLEKRYAGARIEIQVASVLMHAWSEVEHDLVYKPFEGDLSVQELDILDQLNGLVVAGEVSLEMLQRAGETRVSETERPMRNHYDLAVHLLGRVTSIPEESVGDQELGRVDLLFSLLGALGLATPSQLAPYLTSLHGDLELRPIAEQVIDAIIATDSSRYKTFAKIQEEDRNRRSNNPSGEDKRHESIGRFIEGWIRLENELEALVPPGRKGRQHTVATLIRELDLPSHLVDEVHFLRSMRNGIMHGFAAPPASAIMDAAKRLEKISEEISGNSTKGS
ncbi:hypothetical protein ACFVH7_29225 [Kitasatospora indigofera]|uniref:hypothetical protein n=1 Tax=Kitasatospora indigofera TaxID=67307 RepID=UPI00362571E0